MMVGRSLRAQCLYALVAFLLSSPTKAPAQVSKSPSSDPVQPQPANPSDEELRRMADEATEKAERLMRESFCLPVPDMKMLEFHGKKKSLKRVMDSKGTTILILVNDFEGSVRWAKLIAEGQWEMPEPYKNPVFLVYESSLGRLSPHLLKLGHTYRAAPPLPGYLGVVTMFPTALYVSSEGLFEGYQATPETPPVMKPGGCHAPH